MNVELKKNVETMILCLSTATHFWPIKGNRIPYYVANAAIGGMYVSPHQVGVHHAHDHECRGGKGC